MVRAKTPGPPAGRAGRSKLMWMDGLRISDVVPPLYKYLAQMELCSWDGRSTQPVISQGRTQFDYDSISRLGKRSVPSSSKCWDADLTKHFPKWHSLQISKVFTPSVKGFADAGKQEWNISIDPRLGHTFPLFSSYHILPINIKVSHNVRLVCPPDLMLASFRQIGFRCEFWRLAVTEGSNSGFKLERFSPQMVIFWRKTVFFVQGNAWS